MNNVCERCGALEVAEERSVEDVYNARLCMKCINDWVFFILHQPILLEFRAIHNEIDCTLAVISGGLTIKPDEALININYLHKQNINKKIELIGIIKEWIRGNIQ